jgi:hypothetical protein
MLLADTEGPQRRPHRGDPGRRLDIHRKSDWQAGQEPDELLQKGRDVLGAAQAVSGGTREGKLIQWTSRIRGSVAKGVGGIISADLPGL